MKELRQITKDEALTIFNSGLWRDLTKRERAEFQMDEIIPPENLIVVKVSQ